MKEALKVLSYGAAIVVGGALLAPPLYWAGQWAIRTDVLPQLAPFPFSKYFNRAVLLIAVVLLWPFLRWLGLRRWTDLQLSPNPRRGADLAVGFLVALMGLCVVAALMLATDTVIFRRMRWDKVLAALVTGSVVAVIEELFFRGALFGVLRRSLSWQRALGFLSVLFAVLHFIKPHKDADKLTEVSWTSGFALLPYSFWQFSQPQLLLGSFVTLLLVAWILGYTVVRTRSLYMAIGLHAGWVFALKSFGALTKRNAAPSLWLGRDVASGLAAVLLLVATAGVVMWLLRQRTTADPALGALHPRSGPAGYAARPNFDPRDGNHRDGAGEVI
jgi:membrane protease YdiL (CAAX protease family)